MKIIVGLGNPGKEYKGTRHNTGFMVLDKLAGEREIAPVNEVLNFKFNKRLKSDLAETVANGEKVVLVKPRTFMNLSGEGVELILQYYKADIADLIVIFDDIDLPLGYIRIRGNGSSGGHRGVQNIIDVLGTKDFIRYRIGVSDENPYDRENRRISNQKETISYVLSKFDKRHQKLIEKVVEEVSGRLVQMIGSKEICKAETVIIK